MNSDTTDDIPRLPDGRFKPGTSGNPHGRPKTENTALRIQLSEKGADVADIVIKAALSGDMQACKMILDRISPPLRPQAAPIAMEIPPSRNASDIAHAFITAAAYGQLPPDTASQLVGAVGTLARIIEVDELKDRIESLERAIKESSK